MACILVVDDEAVVRQRLEGQLREAGYRVLQAADGREALRVVTEEKPDLVLLDLIMPGYDGMQVLRILKSERDAFMPVIMLTARGDMDSKLQGLKLGADDYLTKPAEPKEILARIEALLRIKRLHEQMEEDRKQQRDTGLVDEKTGLYNAIYLKQRLADEFRRAERYHEPLSCIALRLEETERMLREESEEALRRLAHAIQRGVREFDVAVRQTEDRFVVLLPRTHFAGSVAVAGRLWRLVSEVPLSEGRPKDVARVSMGVSFYPNPQVRTAKQLMDRAIEAQGLASREGCEQICLYQSTAYFYKPEAA